MIYKQYFSAVQNNLGTKKKGKRTDPMAVALPEKANTDVFCIPAPSLHFLFAMPFSGGSFTTCVQRKLLPFHPAWQTESSEDKKPFLP